MSKILINGVVYDGVQRIQVPSENGDLATFYKDTGGIPILDTLDESLLTRENKGRIYKHNGKFYVIEEVYVPVEDGEQGTAFFLEDGKMVTPTAPGYYSLSPASINGGGFMDYVIQVPLGD